VLLHDAFRFFTYFTRSSKLEHENGLFIICKGTKIVVIKYKNRANLFFSLLVWYNLKLVKLLKET
jgi:hypothetical protein